MTTITHRRRDKNGKIEVVPLGKYKMKEIHPRDSMKILAKRSRITRAFLEKEGRLEKRRTNRDKE